MAKTDVPSIAAKPAATVPGSAQDYLLLSVVTLFWGGNFIAAKFTVPHVPPFTLAAVRFALTSLCLLLVLRFSRGPKQSVRLADLPIFIAIGATGYILNGTLFYTGMRVASAVEGAIIMATNPALTAVVAALLVRERFTLAKLGGLVLAFSGVVVATVEQGGPAIAADHILADLILLAAALAWAFYSVLGKFALRRFSALETTSYASMAGTVMLIPLALLVNGVGPLFTAPSAAWQGILYMVFFSSVVANVLWYRGVAHIGASRSALFMNGVPVAAMFLAALILGEAITLGRVLGLVLVISGIFLANRGPARH